MYENNRNVLVPGPAFEQRSIKWHNFLGEHNEDSFYGLCKISSSSVHICLKNRRKNHFFISRESREIYQSRFPGKGPGIPGKPGIPFPGKWGALLINKQHIGIYF